MYHLYHSYHSKFLFFDTYCLQELYLSAICMTVASNSYWPRFGLMEGKIFVVTNASDKRNKCLLHKEWSSSITVSAVSNHLLVSCQQYIVWWSCQCHFKFVFYVICKSATFLRDLPFHTEFQSRSMIFGEVTNNTNRDQYHVNLQEGGKRREPQSASKLLSKSIDLKYIDNYR